MRAGYIYFDTVKLFQFAFGSLVQLIPHSQRGLRVLSTVLRACIMTVRNTGK